MTTFTRRDLAEVGLVCLISGVTILSGNILYKQCLHETVEQTARMTANYVQVGLSPQDAAKKTIEYLSPSAGFFAKDIDGRGKQKYGNFLMATPLLVVFGYGFGRAKRKN